ncbi:thermonuclease family protein [Rhodophyticola sp. CCM32]|uniref:thermonuclease family protein n=1 Tax=Rhodophyticola sp. CCM32 TaxID=2916397 RepID=UPI003FD1C7C6
MFRILRILTKTFSDTPTRKHAPRRKAPPVIRVARDRISGNCYVIDGDTIVIRKLRIRLWGIDAPELDHPWGQKAKWAVLNMTKGKTITAVFNGDTSHDRAVAKCFLPDGTDIAAELGSGLIKLAP